MFESPYIIDECKRLKEQTYPDLENFADLILQLYADGIKFVAVYDNGEKTALDRYYRLDDVVKAYQNEQIKFLNKNDHYGHANGRQWCLQFTNGITLPEVSYFDIISEIDNGLDPDSIICEGKGFRNAALGLAALAGLGQSYNMLDHDIRFNEPSIMDVINTGVNNINQNKCVAPDYIEEPTPEELNNNMRGITSAKPNWKKHRVDYVDQNGNIRYSLGKGNLSSRTHNPGNLVVNNSDSVKNLGAIGYYQADKGNKYAIFPNDAAGEKALKNWWFTGAGTEKTVNQLLPKFAPRSENNLEDYFSTMRKFCVPLDKPIKQFSQLEKTNLINAIKTHEGFHRNKATEYQNYNTSK